MIKRIAALFLVVLLLIGMIPSAFAEEIPGNNISESESASEQTLSDDSEDEYGVMALASTQSSIMLFDYADNGNYTTVLNSQVTCAYKPNGTGTTRTAYIKNLGWHFARYGGVAYADDPLYCIEPWRSYAASTSGNSVDREVTLDGSGSTTGSNVWYALPAERREAIGLILLYSNQMWDHSISVTTTTKDNNPNVPLRIATQFLIYEIVCGLRDPSTSVWARMCLETSPVWTTWWTVWQRNWQNIRQHCRTPAPSLPMPRQKWKRPLPKKRSWRRNPHG